MASGRRFILFNSVRGSDGVFVGLVDQKRRTMHGGAAGLGGRSVIDWSERVIRDLLGTRSWNWFLLLLLIVGALAVRVAFLVAMAVAIYYVGRLFLG